VRRREFIALAGGAAAWPVAARAQQDIKVHRIAFVHPSIPVSMQTETGRFLARAFFAELRGLGSVEGSNLAIDRHSGAWIDSPRPFGRTCEVRCESDARIARDGHMVDGGTP
jgi:hypothetical protein